MTFKVICKLLFSQLTIKTSHAWVWFHFPYLGMNWFAQSSNQVFSLIYKPQSQKKNAFLLNIRLKNNHECKRSLFCSFMFCNHDPSKMIQLEKCQRSNVQTKSILQQEKGMIWLQVRVEMCHTIYGLTSSSQPQRNGSMKPKAAHESRRSSGRRKKRSLSRFHL